MPESRTKKLILLCGILISAATPLCQAQEPGKLFDVKLPQAAVSPAFVPDISNAPAAPITAEATPVRDSWEHPWYVLILEWLAMDIARHNTEKQDNGRPDPLLSVR